MVTALPSCDRRNFVSILTQEGTIEAVIFTTVGQRVQDLVNDERAFLPVELLENGTRIVKLLNKRYIVSIHELPYTAGRFETDRLT
jgi:hypothetical protein